MILLKNSARNLTYIYIVALFLVSMLPINGKDSAINKIYFTSAEIRLDYLLHSILLVPWMPLRILYEKTSRSVIFQWLSMGMMLAVSVEAVQYILPYRTYNIIDLLANIIGVFIGLLLWTAINYLLSMYKLN